MFTASSALEHSVWHVCFHESLHMLMPKQRFLVLASTLMLIAANAQSEMHSSLREAVDQVSAFYGQAHPELYAPLQQLGLALQRDGRHAAAIDSFRRMQSLVHREAGVYSTLQAQSIEHIIRSQVAQQQFVAADQQQKFLYSIMSREHASADPEMSAARRRLADWYRNTYRYDEALKLYEESHHYLSLQDDKTLAHTSLFLAEAETLHLSSRCCASGALKQAIEHVTATTDYESKRRLRLDYADALMLESDTQAALQAYKQVVSASKPLLLGLRNANEIDEVRKKSRPGYNPATEVFQPPLNENEWVNHKGQQLPATVGSPVTLCASEFAAIYDKGDFANYVLDVQVLVDKSGRAQQVNVQGNAPNSLRRYVSAVAKRSRYRPGFSEDGTSEPATVIFQQTFPDDNEQTLTDDLSGWNSLLVRRTCALVDRPMLTASN
ncbi:MAG: tetratricopeptide (TPR) repeat protein [Candidatus Pseudothioglobus sp.]|jgi:tetratricopeptide (TPR) repeat protein